MISASGAARSRIRAFWFVVWAAISFPLAVSWAAAETSGSKSTSDPIHYGRVVLITVDSLRADHLGVYGGSIPTPTLDGLAADGLVMDQAATPIPTTGPALASLMTGTHPWRHKTLANAVLIDPQFPKVAERFHAKGVDTAAFVSSYLLDRRFGYTAGFESYAFEPTENHFWRRVDRKFWSRGESTVAAAMNWITAHPEKPFFVWIHLFDTHRPYRPPVGYAVSPSHRIEMDRKQVPAGVRNRAELERLNRAYLGEVAYVDAQIGKLITRLRLLGLLAETAVVLTSGHGEGLGDHGLLEHGRNLYEELIRVPMIIRAPGLLAGRRMAGPVQLEDLAPTLLALGGVADPFISDGKNLLPWLRGESDASPREWIIGQRRAFDRSGPEYFARRGAYKWVGRLDEPGKVYSLDTDPFELAGQPGTGPPEALLRSVADAAEQASESDPESAANPDPEVRKGLEDLGYSDD